MDNQHIVTLLRENGAEICQRFGLKRLSLFGSVARNEAAAGSDVDVLAEFIGPADFDTFMELKFHLEKLLDAQVDLVTDKALRPRLRPIIEREAIHVT